MTEVDILINIESVLNDIQELILLSNYQGLVIISLNLLIITFLGFWGFRK